MVKRLVEAQELKVRYLLRPRNIGLSSNGRTHGFGPCYEGSNPSGPENLLVGGLMVRPPTVHREDVGSTTTLPEKL